jgi:hypothetical protein
MAVDWLDAWTIFGLCSRFNATLFDRVDDGAKFDGP